MSFEPFLVGLCLSFFNQLMCLDYSALKRNKLAATHHFLKTVTVSPNAQSPKASVMMI